MSASLIDPVLIVSTGRTGTRFLAQFLGSHYPCVEAHHTTDWSRLMNVLGNMQLTGLIGEGAVLAAWRTLKGQRFAMTEKSHFVDSNNHLFAFAAIARRVYPGVRIIHVVRDPRTYVRSHLNWSKQRLSSYVANYLIPFWQPNGWLLREVGFKEWVTMSKFEKFCWIWDFKNRLMAAIEATTVPYLRVRFEDVTGLSGEGDQLDMLLRFVGLDPDNRPRGETRPVNETTERKFPGWEKWSSADCLALERHCGEQMRRYGYGCESRWLERVRHAS